MTNRTLLLWGLALALAAPAAGCRGSDPAPAPPKTPLDLLPPETQTGQRTFGCLLNGQAWVLSGSPLGGPVFSSEYASKHLRLTASGSSVDNGVITGGVMQIEIDDLNSPGRYTLSSKDTSFVNYDSVRPRCQYHTDKAHPATVEITRLDLVNRVVAGRFAFTLDTPGCGPVVVTDGRFDSRF